MSSIQMKCKHITKVVAAIFDLHLNGIGEKVVDGHGNIVSDMLNVFMCFIVTPQTVHFHSIDLANEKVSIIQQIELKLITDNMNCGVNFCDSNGNNDRTKNRISNGSFSMLCKPEKNVF